MVLSVLFSSRRRHTRCALVTGVQTCALPIWSQLASAKAQRAAQAVRLRNARIVAPDDGVISSRSATIGAVGAPGVELFRLVRQSRLEWRAEVPSKDMSRLTPDVGVDVQLLDGTRVSGKLREIGRAHV